MCTYSMAFDFWDKRFPPVNDPIYLPYTPLPNYQELQKMIEDALKSFKAAKIVDDLTDQPDCEDLEKAKLLERIAILEKKLAKMSKWDKSVGKKTATKKKIAKRRKSNGLL